MSDNIPQIITDVQHQKGRETRRSIFINDEFAFGVSEEIYVKHSLFKGRELTEEFIAEVLADEEFYKAKGTAMRMLNLRLRSEGELRRKLVEKKYSPEAIEATLRFLAEYRMVDDEAFARSFVNDQLLKRPMGRRRLTMALREKGIDKEMIEQVLSGTLDDDEELRNAMTAAEKKAPMIRHVDRQKWERSMASFLSGRGFGWDVIGKVLASLRDKRGEF